MSEDLYRPDSLFRLNLEQQAALSIALNVAWRRCGGQDDADMDICGLDAFLKRYGGACKNQEEREKQQKFFNEIKKFLNTLRNYFSHYLHTKEKVESLLKEEKFREFVSFLRRKALEVWNKRFENSALFSEMQAFSQNGWEEMEGELKESGPFLTDVLLFVSVFVPRGEMMRLLDAFRLSPNREKRECRREILSALCLPESYDFWSVNKKAGIALTILDHFARNMGKRTDKAGKLIMSPPCKPEKRKEMPEICRRFRPSFFIRMLVGFIEEENVLKGFEFARSYNGRPVYGEPKKELYICRNNTRVRFSDDEGNLLESELGAEALKQIVLLYLKKKQGAVKGHDLAPLVGGKIKGIQKKTPQRENRTNAALLQRVKSRLDELSNRFFRKGLSDHQKAVAVLDLMNLIFPADKKFGKLAYQEALRALTGKYDEEAFLAVLPDIKCSETPFPKGKKPQIWAKGAKSLETLHRRAEVLFREKAESLCEETAEEIGRLFHVRALKEKTGETGEAFERFRKLLTPPPRAFTGKDFGRTKEELLKDILLDAELYAPGGRPMASAVKKIYDNDRLLLKLARLILEQIRRTHKVQVQITEKPDYNYEVLVTVGERFQMIIDSAQARRSHVNLNAVRLKNVLQNYWKREETSVPFVVPDMRKREKNDPPRCWTEAEQDMERERRTMVETLLKWEKYLANEFAKENKTATGNIDALIELMKQENKEYVDFPLLLERMNISKASEYNDFRRWAYHQAPGKAFSDAPGELKERFLKRQAEKDIKRREQKKSGIKKFKKNEIICR